MNRGVFLTSSSNGQRSAHTTSMSPSASAASIAASAASSLPLNAITSAESCWKNIGRRTARDDIFPQSTAIAMRPSVSTPSAMSVENSITGPRSGKSRSVVASRIRFAHAASRFHIARRADTNQKKFALSVSEIHPDSAASTACHWPSSASTRTMSDFARPPYGSIAIAVRSATSPSSGSPASTSKRPRKSWTSADPGATASASRTAVAAPTASPKLSARFASATRGSPKCGAIASARSAALRPISPDSSVPSRSFANLRSCASA